MNDLTLQPGRFSCIDGPLLTIVMDGVGLSSLQEGNAVFHASTPHLDALFKGRLSREIKAHGRAVGLPSDGDLGNSEVGHNALGCGRIFEQGASLVEGAITSGRLFASETWQWLTEPTRSGENTLHFIGLVSDGNVHSHIRHLYAMVDRAAAMGVAKVRVHALLDGRDVGEMTALEYIEPLEAHLDALSVDGRDYAIASGGGRMVITMDRYDADWPMVERGWAHHVRGEGRRFKTASQAIRTLRAETGKTDQFLEPFVIARDGKAVGPIRDGDSVCFFNFRGDRAIEISRAFEDGRLDAFERGDVPEVRYCGMMQYDGDLAIPNRYLVAPPEIDRTLGAHLAHQGVSQFACSETQKFGHVTYFWNGNRTGRFDDKLETYLEVPSDVIPFEQTPAMKAPEIVTATLDAIQNRRAKALRINLANGDMVGHTGVYDAAIAAMQSVDTAVGRLLDGVKRAGGLALIMADHGNCEEMFERNKKTGDIALRADGQPKPKTSHTLNPVPFVIYDPAQQIKVDLDMAIANAGLANVAATTLELLGFAPPEDYAPSLLGR
ncbi:MAG: 2,3-bisphosphoglycerate-independent phosphoglycerate mutase [Bradymonadia bacterium]